jgi:hypothetical protein
MTIQYGYSFLNANVSEELLGRIYTVDENVLLDLNVMGMSDQYELDKGLRDMRIPS